VTGMADDNEPLMPTAGELAEGGFGMWVPSGDGPDAGMVLVFDEDGDLLDRIQRARAIIDRDTETLRALIRSAREQNIPLREVASASGWSHETIRRI